MTVLRINDVNENWQSKRLHLTLDGRIVIGMAGDDLMIVAAENNYLYVPRASVKSLVAYTRGPYE